MYASVDFSNSNGQYSQVGSNVTPQQAQRLQQLQRAKQMNQQQIQMQKMQQMQRMQRMRQMQQRQRGLQQQKEQQYQQQLQMERQKHFQDLQQQSQQQRMQQTQQIQQHVDPRRQEMEKQMQQEEQVKMQRMNGGMQQQQMVQRSLRAIFFYSLHCRHCKQFMTLLQNSRFARLFAFYCVDKNPKTGQVPRLPKFLKSVPTIVVNNNIYSGKKAFQWLYYANQQGQRINKGNEGNQNQMLGEITGKVQGDGQVDFSDIRAFMPKEMGGTHDGTADFSFIEDKNGNAATIEQSFQFIDDKPINLPGNSDNGINNFDGSLDGMQFDQFDYNQNDLQMDRPRDQMGLMQQPPTEMPQFELPQDDSSNKKQVELDFERMMQERNQEAAKNMPQQRKII